MARITVQLSESEQAIVASERFSHADLPVRRKMLVLWAVHTGLTRLGTGSELTLTQDGTLPEWVDRTREGWSKIVDALSEVLATEAA